MPDSMQQSLYPILKLKPGKEQSVQRYHPWVFSGALASDTSGLTEGALVKVLDSRGKFLAIGHFQIGSIALRLLTFQEEEVNREFWKQKLRLALDLRQQLGFLNREDHNTFRWVHGEGDGMPGLIVDVYDRTLVMQSHSVGFWHIREMIAELLVELFPREVAAVFDKSAHTVPYKAGLNAKDEFLIGSESEVQALEYGDQYQIDLVEGQKTGFFLDQRENRALLARYATGRDVLNTFCYTGGFSVAALRGGAQKVVSVDSSERAVELTRRNVEMNFGAGEVPHEAHKADVFSFIKNIYHEYDLIVLDPPSFGKHRKVLAQALKGYRSLNQRAFEQIRPGGILFTFSCSQPVTKDDFRRAVFTAAAIARRKVRILHQLTQPADHPINIYHPEGEYLKGLVLAVE